MKKRRVLSLLLLLTLALSLSVPVFATDGEENQQVDAGLYLDGAAPATVTVTMKTGGALTDATSVTAYKVAKVDGTKFVNVYVGAARMQVTVKNPAAETQYVAILVSGYVADDAVPTLNNDLAYINQTGDGAFDVYPKTMTASTALTLFIIGSDNSKIVVHCGYATAGTYTVKTYTLGDVDGVNGITTNDATMILLYIVDTENYPLTGSGQLAADVDRKGGVTAGDAAYILQYIASNKGYTSVAEFMQGEFGN